MATRTRKDTLTESGLVRLVADYLDTKAATEEFGKRLRKIKDRLAAYVDESGTADEKGNLWVELPESAPAPTIKREKRVSRFLDEEAAEKFLKRKRLYSECTTTITVLDEEKILHAHYTGKITEDELDALYGENVVWALKVQ